jgi:hypothetical protein
MDQSDDPPDETEFARFVLPIDPKNFHAWSYFGWLAGRFGRAQWLFDLTVPFIQTDPLNNSAWSARYRALKIGGFSTAADIDFALPFLQLSPRSESTCNYVKGLLALDFSEKSIEKVKATITGLVDRKSATKAIYQLAAHVALMLGNTDEYDAWVGKIIAMDPRRTVFWTRMKSDSTAYQ